MSIVIVGGHDRMHRQYKEICKKYGCKCNVASKQEKKTGTAIKHCHSSNACTLNEVLREHFQRV